MKKLTTFDICNIILLNIANKAAEVFTYKNWSDEFCRNEINRTAETIRASKGFIPVDPYELSLKEMDELGFRRWSDDSDLMLIPFWLASFLKHGIQVESIDGECYYFDETTADNDHRYGCLAYGICPTK